MKIVIFGLSISSSWGNGHATLWRGLCRALAGYNHDVVFFERDQSYYAQHRDLTELPGGGELILYSDWPEVAVRAREHLAEADVGIVTSYCCDALDAADLMFSSRVRLRVFYDLDTPITLSRLQAGETVSYIGQRGLGDYDLVLSYTGGAALAALQDRLGARRVAPLYGSVDPQTHYPVAAQDRFRADLSYLGTYSEDRQHQLEALLLAPARRLVDRRFLLGGAQYPQKFPWTKNLYFVRHVPPADHPPVYCSSSLTLNITRQAMADMGYCPSGRLFEAAACGAAILSDCWEGLDTFFEPGRELLIARNTDEAIAAIEMPANARARIGGAARERVLEAHTADARAAELLELLEASAVPLVAATGGGSGKE